MQCNGEDRILPQVDQRSRHRLLFLGGRPSAEVGHGGSLMPTMECIYQRMTGQQQHIRTTV